MPIPLRRFMERELYDPRRADPYRSQSKPKGHVQCPSCKAINLKGSWYSRDAAVRRLELPVQASAARINTALRELVTGRETCPACRQLQDHYAESVVELHGKKWRDLEAEVTRTIRNTEGIARYHNDQERVLWTETFRGVMKIYVTLPELARHIGRSLHRAFKGDLQTHRSSEESFVRLIWDSDAVGPRRRGVTGRSRQWRGRGAKR